MVEFKRKTFKTRDRGSSSRDSNRSGERSSSGYGGRSSGGSSGYGGRSSGSSSGYGGRSSGGSSGYGGRDSGRPDRREIGRFGGRKAERTEVKCDSCKKMCEVPFKPTANKPVYCDSCFKQDSSSKSKNYANELIEINNKIDIIMKILEKN